MAINHGHINESIIRYCFNYSNNSYIILDYPCKLKSLDNK